MEMLICLSYLPTLLRAIRIIQVFASLAWLETDLKVPPRDHSPSFLPWLYNTLWSLQRLFGTTTNVTDPSIGNHTCLHNALPAQLDTKVLNLISSFRCIVASVEEPSFQQSLWDISLPAQRLVDALPSVWRQKHVVCHDLVNFDPELILCHSWSGKKKRRQGLCMRCASKSGSFFHDKASAMKFGFLDDKGKWKGRTKRRRARRQSRERLTSSLNTLPDWGAGHHHFQSCSLTAVLSILKVRFH